MYHSISKRLWAALLAVCLAVALAVPALAEDPAATAAPAPAAAGTVPTVEGIAYYGTDYIQFALTGTPGTAQYFCDLTYEDGGALQYLARRAVCTPGTSIGFDVPSASFTYTLTVYTLEPYTVVATGKSVTAWAVLGGQTPEKRVAVGLCTVGCDAAGNQTQTLTYAPSSTYYDSDADVDYDLAGSADVNVLLGAPCEVPYTPYTAASLKGSVTFVDDAGRVLSFVSTQGAGTLDKAEVTVTQSGTDGAGKTALALDAIDGVTKQPDGSFTLTGANGTLYTVSQQGLSALVFNYYGTIHFVVNCTDPTVSDFYYANIRYVDESGALLFSDRVYIKEQYTFYAPTSFSMNTAGSVHYYETTAQQAVLTFAPGAPVAERTKTVQYTKSNGTRPYNWAVRLLDAKTGALLDDGTLSALTFAVNPADKGASAVTYTPAASLSVNGVAYQLDASHMQGGAPQTYSHSYGDAGRVLYLYYIPAGYTRPASYPVNVQYVNIADRRVLTSSSVTATPAQDALIDCPASFEAGGVTYVRLGGQPDTYAHNYNNPQRTYSIYYRDKDAAQFEDTTITTTEIIDSERLVETIIDRGVNADGTLTAGAAGGQTLTAATNGTTGETTLLTPGGTEAADAREQIAENETPLAPAPTTVPGDEQVPTGFFSGKSGALRIALCALGALLTALVIILVIFGRKRRKRAAEAPERAPERED